MQAYLVLDNLKAAKARSRGR